MTEPKNLEIRNFEELQKIILQFDKEDPNPYGYILDLTNYITFIRPLFVVTIAQFVRFYRAKGIYFHAIKLSDTNTTSRYLRSIDFENRFHNNFEADISFSCPESSLPITPVDQEDIPNKKIKIVNFLKDKGFQKDFTVIEVCLDEILNNCFDHAKSLTGVVAHAQFFSRTNAIKLAICDTGIGISQCVNSYMTNNGMDQLSSEDAIKWAFIKTNTTKSTPRNRGLGLDNLLTVTRTCNGEFRMITLDKWVLNSPSIDFKMRDTSAFFGTAIEIEINLDHLSDIEYEDLDFDDF